MQNDLIRERNSVKGYRGSGGAVTVPEGMRWITAGSVRDQTAITSVTLPESLSSIGEGAFRRCTSLTDVSIPGGVAILQKDCFRGCSALRRVTLTDGLQSIGDTAFYACTALETLTIPRTVTKLGRDVFMGCSALHTLTFCGPIDTIGSGAFVDCGRLTGISLGGVTVPFHCLRGDQRIETSLIAALSILAGDLRSTVFTPPHVYAVCILALAQRHPPHSRARAILKEAPNTFAKVLIRYDERDLLRALIASPDLMSDRHLAAFADETAQMGAKEYYLLIVNEMQRRGLLDAPPRRL